MGTIIRFPRNHARTSSNFRAAKPAKTSRVISGLPLAAAKATTLDQCAAGMPRVFQPLTVESDCPSSPATSPRAPVASPQRVLMSESQLSIASNIVRTLRTCQGFATSETIFSGKCGPMEPTMDPNTIISARLRALRKELGEREGIHGGYSQTEFADKLGLTKSTYNPFETGNRALTFETACLIRRRFGIPIDWLFFGDMPKIDNELLFKLGPEPKTPVRTKRTASHK
jgi:transcriptional regulator with XRE-family HTH domain